MLTEPNLKNITAWFDSYWIIHYYCSVACETNFYKVIHMYAFDCMTHSYVCSYISASTFLCSLQIFGYGKAIRFDEVMGKLIYKLFTRTSVLILVVIRVVLINWKIICNWIAINKVRQKKINKKKTIKILSKFTMTDYS